MDLVFLLHLKHYQPNIINQTNIQMTPSSPLYKSINIFFVTTVFSYMAVRHVFHIDMSAINFNIAHDALKLMVCVLW